MKFTRREFVELSLAGTAGLCLGSLAPLGRADESPMTLPEEDGYRLWLRYGFTDETGRNKWKSVPQIRVEGTSATCEIIRNEFRAATTGLPGELIAPSTSAIQEGALIVGTPTNSAFIRNLNWTADLGAISDEGFIIRSTRADNKAVTVIASNTDVGTLYGAFHFLRLMQTEKPTNKLDLVERPALQLRLMNHWDNPTGTIERGYAGRSLWQWNELPGTLSPRYADYARACASIGINGAVITEP